jgi:hypothetical protein
MKVALKQRIIGALGGFLMSFHMNYFVLPLPHSVLGNALGNGMSGILSGFMGGFLGLLGYQAELRRRNRRAQSVAE